ncbi:hypothetical protein [Methylosinus sp. C49]|uniref:hypothetical protein n=1 Tax=Methylosinus sp. C49 TaxID=2699395 RepID=UPI00137A9970|nr:hypothetical protein [Methylosinus sp. C49]
MLKRLSQMIAVWTFRNEKAAAHCIRFGGSVAGAVDQCDEKRVRGWICDLKRLDISLDLEILLDGKVVMSTRADLYRDDVAALVSDNGRHGFDCKVDAFGVTASKVRLVSVRLTDRPNYLLGPFKLAPSKPSADLQVLDHMLADILVRLTEMNEETLRRFDATQAAIDDLQSKQAALGAKGSNDIQRSSASLYEISRCGISRAGQFGVLLAEDD